MVCSLTGFSFKSLLKEAKTFCEALNAFCCVIIFFEKINERSKLIPKLPGQLLKSKARNSVNAQQSKRPHQFKVFFCSPSSVIKKRKLKKSGIDSENYIY